MFIKRLSILLYAVLLIQAACAQQTTGIISGTISSATGNLLAGAEIKLTHTATGFLYTTRSQRSGYYTFQNVDAGTGYVLTVNAAGYLTYVQHDITINLGGAIVVDIPLSEKTVSLAAVTVTTKRKRPVFITATDADKIALLPASGNLHDYLRTMPEARLPKANEGAVTFAGQNNRFNAFYIDGAVSNDVFGLSASGMNGGQAAISPVSIDGIHELQVAISPADVSVGNFTGAAIQAVTRSGTNHPETSVYHFFTNGFLTGKKPDGLAADAIKLSGFSLRTTGLRTQGAIAQNRLFYFINLELQRDERPQVFDMADYLGNTRNVNTYKILANTLQANFQYNPGTFLDNPTSVMAARLMTRFDWNAGPRSKLMISYRHTNGTRLHANISTPAIIHFSNDGYTIHTQTRSLSLEIKTNFREQMANRILLSYTSVGDNRHATGPPFPRVSLKDGESDIVFGTDISSTINLLTQQNLTLFDKFTFLPGTHTIDIGVDAEYSRVQNSFVQNAFGSYNFSSLSDFLTNAHPSYFQAGYAAAANSSNTLPSVNLSTIKLGIFVSDNIRLTRSLSLMAGLRLDQYHFFNMPGVDRFVAETALPAFAKYYAADANKVTGRLSFPASLSPRMEISFSPAKKISFRSGIGLFAGRIPLAWVAGAYLDNGRNVLGYASSPTELNRMRFRADPTHPWQPSEVGARYNSIPLNFTAADLQLPEIARAWFTVSFTIGDNWHVKMECVQGKNLTEIFYGNINLLPPINTAIGADTRSVYTITDKGRIPLPPDNFNPFDYAILLHNYAGKKGSAANYGFLADKRTTGGDLFEIGYHYNHSVSVTDGTSSVSESQWRFSESVNGRNAIGLSQSDFSGGHHIFILAGKQLSHGRHSNTTTFSISCTGESGQPFSYVYGNASMVRDDGPVGYYDLVYIPTPVQLQAMQFIPYSAGNATVDARQQKDAFEQYIAGNAYLRNRRGQYAQRNATRTSFMQSWDLKVKQEFLCRMNRKIYRVAISADVFNLGNLLNRNWGHKYIIPNDNFSLVNFIGYVSESNLVPQYQFKPAIGVSDPWAISSSLTPFYSSRWLSRLGFRITF